MLEHIENKTATELKEHCEALVQEAEKAPIKELASRYVQARTDAKRRDELLADQGKTITSLREGLAATQAQATEAVERVTKRLAEVQGELGQHVERLQARVESLGESLDETHKSLGEQDESLTQEKLRSTRLKIEALKNSAAISGAAKLLNDAIAQQVIETADQG